MKLLVFVFALTLLASSHAAWESLCGSDSECPTMMMGISCENPNMCAIVGGYSNTPMGVYYSKDGFKNFTRADMKEDSLMLMDIAIDNMGTGATAGMGAGNDSALLYTTDVTDWQSSAFVSFAVGQDINAFENGEFGFVGTTNNLANTEGVLVSSDGGKDWTEMNWPEQLSNMTQARYGSFPSDKVLYVSGGQWPSNNNNEAGDCFPMSKKTCVKMGRQYASRIAAQHSRMSKKWMQGYFAILTKSEDGGKTWQVQFQDKGNFYFNDINCISTSVCFAVGEGFTDGNEPGARIYRTTDGKNWERVFFSNSTGASLMRVHAVSNLEAWAAGGHEKDGVAYGTFYHTTDGGKTWDLEEVEYVGDVMGLHMENRKVGFAVGVTQFQTSTVMRYSA